MSTAERFKNLIFECAIVFLIIIIIAEELFERFRRTRAFHQALSGLDQRQRRALTRCAAMARLERKYWNRMACLNGTPQSAAVEEYYGLIRNQLAERIADCCRAAIDHWRIEAAIS